MLEDIQQGTGVAPGSCMSLEAQLGCGWENGCWNDLLGGTGVARGIWWHGDGTWRSQHGDGTGVAPGVCTPSVIQGWHVALGGTGWHPGSASPRWHRGGTGVALSWGSQQHPAAGLAPAETEKSRWRLRHLPPCLLSPIPFFSSSLQQNQPLWREALHAVGHRGCRFVPAGRSS